MKLLKSKIFLIFYVLCCVACKNPVQHKDVQYLAIGTYTETLDFVDGQAEGFYIYTFDKSNGSIDYLCTSPYIANPSFLAVNPDGKEIYVVSETQGPGQYDFGKIAAYEFDAANDTIKFVNEVSSMGKSPCFISLSQDRKEAYAANYGGGIAVFPLSGNGIVEASQVIYHEGNSTHERQEASHPHMIEEIYTGTVVVADLGTNSYYKYATGFLTDSLVLNTIIPAGKNEAGPRHFAYNEKSNLLYFFNELNNMIEVIDNSSDMSIQMISSIAPGDTNTGTSAEIMLHPSGKFLYASTRGTVNGISVFTVNPSDGLLTFKSFTSSKGLTPRYFTFDPDGEYLLTANQDSNTIVTFRIDQQTGQLIDEGIVSDVPTPVCIKFF